MRKIISFMHISLDGFVAGPNGEMDWIKVDEEIFDYVGKRISEGDTALYGRVTYQMMENYWPTAGNKPAASKHYIEHSKWYNKVHKVVLSKTMKDAGLTNTKIINDNLSDRISECVAVGLPKSRMSLPACCFISFILSERLSLIIFVLVKPVSSIVFDKTTL